MAIVIDIIIVAILAIAILLGYKNGLVKSLIALFGFILAIVLAFTFSTTLGNFIGEKFINPPIKSFVSNTITEKVGKTVLEDVGTAKDDVITVVTKALESVNLKFIGLEDKKNEIINSIKTAPKNETIEQSINNAVSDISAPISNGIGKAIAFVIILIVTMIALVIIKFIFGFVNKLPIIKQFNKLGGLIVGIINGFIIVFIALAVLKVSMPMIESSNVLGGGNNENSLSEKTIEKTFITKIFYYSNPIKF
ncbi:MAG: CvpA family protein [Clostridia bacterium]